MNIYLTVIEILAIHDDLIRRYGGSDGLRDAGALESALFRPQTGYYSDTIAEASALWESLCQNHPFVDGNKRVAFAATYTFLKLNGITLTADTGATYRFVDGLFREGDFCFDRLDAWLRENTSE